MRRVPNVTKKDISAIWPIVSRWVGGASFVPGVDWNSILEAHEGVWRKLRGRSSLTVYRAAPAGVDETMFPTAWTTDRDLAVSLAEDGMRYASIRPRIVLSRVVSPSDVWFVLSDIQSAADGLGMNVIIDSQQWGEVVLKRGTFELSKAEIGLSRKIRSAASKIQRIKDARKARAEARDAAALFSDVSAPRNTRSNPSGRAREIVTIPAGAVLFHGTKQRFDADDLNGPMWVSDHVNVAKFFARKWKRAGKPRVIHLVVKKPIKLVAIRSGIDWSERMYADFSAATGRKMVFGVNTYDPRVIADIVCRSGYDGWYAPGSYDARHDSPEKVMLSVLKGDLGGEVPASDIMLCDPSKHLEAIGEEMLSPVKLSSASRQALLDHQKRSRSIERSMLLRDAK